MITIVTKDQCLAPRILARATRNYVDAETGARGYSTAHLIGIPVHALGEVWKSLSQTTKNALIYLAAKRLLMLAPELLLDEDAHRPTDFWGGLSKIGHFIETTGKVVSVIPGFGILGLPVEGIGKLMELGEKPSSKAASAGSWGASFGGQTSSTWPHAAFSSGKASDEQGTAAYYDLSSFDPDDPSTWEGVIDKKTRSSLAKKLVLARMAAGVAIKAGGGDGDGSDGSSIDLTNDDNNSDLEKAAFDVAKKIKHVTAVPSSKMKSATAPHQQVKAIAGAAVSFVPKVQIKKQSSTSVSTTRRAVSRNVSPPGMTPTVPGNLIPPTSKASVIIPGTVATPVNQSAYVTGGSAINNLVASGGASSSKVFVEKQSMRLAPSDPSAVIYMDCGCSRDDEELEALIAGDSKAPSVGEFLADIFATHGRIVAHDSALTKAHCSDCTRGVVFDASPNTPFFHSSWIRARKTNSLPPKVYGRITLDTMPFEVEIASNTPYPRAAVSLAHEALHAFDYMLKTNLTHEQIHSLANTLVGEVLPALSALQRTYK
jgi:hypothetical protein